MEAKKERKAVLLEMLNSCVLQAWLVQTCGPPVRKLQEVVRLLGPSSASETVRSQEPVAAAVAGLLPPWHGERWLPLAAPEAARPLAVTVAPACCPRSCAAPPAAPPIRADKGATVVSNGAATATVSEIRRRRRPLPRARRQAPPLQPHVRAGAVLPRIVRSTGAGAVSTSRPCRRRDPQVQTSFLEEQYVDQMIEELLDSNLSMEIPREVA